MKKIKVKCKSCNGSGLYKGMAENEQCAVVCNDCRGSGWHWFEYDEFAERTKRNDVQRVFKGTYGFVHSHRDVVDEDFKLIEFSKGGCTYEEWIAGAEPKPVKELYCPYLWTSQHLQSEDVNDLYKTRCRADDGKGLQWGTISSCGYWKDKAKCWKIFEGK